MEKVKPNSLKNRLFCYFLKLLMWLRYRVKVNGVEVLDEITKKEPNMGVLILPTHPSLMDAFNIFSQVVPRVNFAWSMSPVITEDFYPRSRQPRNILEKLMASSNPIPIPSLSHLHSAQEKIEVLESVFNEIADELNSGKNILFFPGGWIKQRPNERLGGNRGLKEVLKRAPNCKIVLMRMTGMWGSIFGWGYSGKHPKESNYVQNGINTFLHNLLFFAPRRNLTLDIAWAGDDFPRSGTSREINAYLEKWYNEGYPGGKEEKLIVPRTFYGKEEEVPELDYETAPKPPHTQDFTSDEQRVVDALAKVAGMKPSEIFRDSSINFDLYIDSIGMVEALTIINTKKDVHLVPIKTVQDLLSLS